MTPDPALDAWAITQLRPASDDDWIELDCEECGRIFRDLHDRDVHLLEQHGIDNFGANAT